jgi:FtsH-binding integral membrane protein
MDTNSVFSRTEIDGTILSDQMYNFLLGAVLFWGFFLNWLIVKIVDPTAVLDVMSIWMFFLMYFASCLCGIWLFTRSTRPVISFLGYNLVVVPFGFVVNIIVAGYDDAIVVNAMEVTCGVVAVMMMMGTVFPRFFQKISTTLFWGLGLVIFFEMYLLFTGRGQPGWIDWAVALLFCGYIGYDWARANQIPKTVDNAIDSAAALYMDIINLFLRILRIMGEDE